MKVLWLAYWYPSAEVPHRATFVRAQWLAARSQGADVDLLHIDFGPGPSSLGWTRGPQGEYVLRVRHVFWKLWYHTPWFTMAYVARTFPGPRPHILHSQVLLPAGLAGRILAKRWGLPTVHTEHWTSAGAKLQHPFWGILVRPVLRDARMVLPVSDQLGAELTAAVPGIICRTVPNVMDWSNFPYRPGRLNPNAPALRVLGVANLNPANAAQKRVEWTLEAIAILQRRHPHLRITYAHVGSGGRQPELSHLASTLGLEVQWLGSMSGTEWAALDVDVMLHPTTVETFGMVVYEALHRGLPVLASDIPAFRPWLLPPFGLLVAEGPEAFADALEQFWMNPFAVPQDGFDFKRFEAQEVGKQLQKIYAGLLTKDGF